ncbi:PREDICTED: uncharacterized protein LOC104723739 isoform X2 [Camelina sativa]|uniref:Uncharacterized protein LOC104723739 isoform X2 n=1 Tax=Camelina sativa TaxID=90675 RepID=A0ABM0UFL8_CAMSA|nr:PREDICTED: uncharacterized protein LOC104723739 isoform X2 [Camelina sativa]XP_010440439.1 PREDICTED: uncharacterized protein LOC104723739 isoform X2 [Camelina sativa]
MPLTSTAGQNQSSLLPSSKGYSYLHSLNVVATSSKVPVRAVTSHTAQASPAPLTRQHSILLSALPKQPSRISLLHEAAKYSSNISSRRSGNKEIVDLVYVTHPPMATYKNSSLHSPRAVYADSKGNSLTFSSGDNECNAEGSGGSDLSDLHIIDTQRCSSAPAMNLRSEKDKNKIESQLNTPLESTTRCKQLNGPKSKPIVHAQYMCRKSRSVRCKQSHQNALFPLDL